MKSLFLYLSFIIVSCNIYANTLEENLFSTLGQNSTPLTKPSKPSRNFEGIMEVAVDNFYVSKEVYSSTNYTFQYTLDGSLQIIYFYQDFSVGTNLEGPREGLQLILSTNGAMKDMCQSCKDYEEYSSHIYSWGEIRTYQSFQMVIIK